jgi:DNA-binding GntR family transcriptional regulator
VDRFHYEPIASGIARKLREAILNGEFAAGQRLVENGLAERLGVSRGPVREAIRRLADQGLVTVRPRRSTVVADVSPADVEEIYGLRELLEGFAIERMLDRPAPDPGAVARLGALVDRMRVMADQGNLPAFMDLDLEFHTSLVRASGHQRLQSLWAVISPQVRRLMVFNERLWGDLNTSAEIHVPILDALRARDARAGVAAVQTHVRESGARVMTQVLRLRGEPLPGGPPGHGGGSG